MIDEQYIIQSVIQTGIIIFILLDMRTRLNTIEKNCNDRLQFCLGYNKDGVN